MKDYSFKINGHQYDVTINNVDEESSVASVVVNGTPYEVEIKGTKVSTIKKAQTTAPSADAAQAVSAARSAAGSGVKVTAPLPGTVVSVKVSVGDKVTAGQTLIVLEAMKMENNIDAVQGGTVKSIDTQAGATVMEGDLLMVIE